MHRPGRARPWKLALAAAGLLLLLLLAAAWRERPSQSATASEARPRGIGFQFAYGDACAHLLNSGGWVGEPLLSCEDPAQLVATCGRGHEDSWQWSSEALKCGAHRLGAEQLRALLGGKWVAVIGDSIARNIYAALLRLIAPTGEHRIVKGHRDFEHALPGDVKGSFFWAPFAANVTSLLMQWTASERLPDALVVSVGLWDMLHISSASAFASNLQALGAAAQALRTKSPGGGPPLALCSLTEVFHPKLRAADKRARMTPAAVDAYNGALAASRLLLPAGEGSLLDVHHLTQGCGGQCTDDGVHYSNATYDAAVQIWGNQLARLAGG